MREAGRILATWLRPGVLGSLAAALCWSSAAAAPPDDALALMVRLTSKDSEVAGRIEAASRLLTMTDEPDVSGFLVGGLQDPGDSTGAWGILVQVIASSTNPPQMLLRPLALRTESAAPAELPDLLAAVGSFRTRGAASLLVSFAGPDRPAAVREAAMRALARLSGHDEFGQNSDAWADWNVRAQAMSEEQWLAELAAALAARADRLAASWGRSLDRLADAMRRLYLASAPGSDERARLLATLLLDDSDTVRTLGFQLVDRELSDGARVGGPACDAAVSLLAHPSPLVRARAARLLVQVGQEDAAGAITAALRAEADPAACEALLAGVARWPTADAVEPVVQRLGVPDGPTPGGLAAALALWQAGLLTGDVDRVRQSVRSLDPAQLGGSGLRLLAAVGDDSDRERIASMLRSGNASVRSAAADALADRPEFTDRLLAAAAEDMGLFPIACRAVAAHSPTAEAYDLVGRLRAPDEESREAGLARVAAALPIEELVAAARRVSDPAAREQMLARLAVQPGGNGAGSPNPDGSGAGPALREGLELLAATRLDLSRPDQALAALDAIPDDAGGEDAAAKALRTVALLWTGRLEQAAELDAPVDVWLDGLERIANQAPAGQVVGAIKRRFGPDLTDAQRARLAHLEARITDERSGPDDGDRAAAPPR